jgi:aminocarboxymuconate-semialdehyde decarboxylase
MPLDDPLIDVHTHVVPENFPAYLGQRLGVPWPSMVPAQACHRHVMVSGKVYRTVSHQCWSCSVRLADMDRSGVTRQVLSPMPELLSHWLEPVDGQALCRFLNDTIASMVAQAPDRFVGLGAVPLQDLDLAIGELEHAVRELGMAGVEIGGHVGGVPIGDARFRPFFAAAAQAGAAVFVHALRPSGMERLVGPPNLEQLLAFPGEVGLAAASLITGGTLAAVPGLRIAFSHGGGSLPTLLPRLRHGWRVLPPLQALMPEDPLLSVRRMFFDDLVYDVDALRRIVDLYGVSQVMAGSDYPFTIMDPDPAASIEAPAFGPEMRTALRSANARRWLSL